MPFLSTMPDLIWNVRVDRWLWIYSFSHTEPNTMSGTVTWRDPWNGKHGQGTWKVAGGSMTIAWLGSTTKEQWDAPFEPRRSTGQCTMSGTTYDLVAEAQNFFLQPGDVVYSGGRIFLGNDTFATVIYADEVRSGGSVAWLACNPGNIRDGSKYGAIPGKHLHVKKAGDYAIFPDMETGLAAVSAVLKVYGRVTIEQAITKYAPPKDHNKTELYIQGVVAALKKFDKSITRDTLVPSLSGDQFDGMINAMTGIETTKTGQRWARGDSDMPDDIKIRLK